MLVKDRIVEFNRLYPAGSIKTEADQVLSDFGKWVIKATVTPDTSKPERVFTGYSQANESQGMINKTAGLENCETSAVGRALAMMGIGVIDSVASVDEMHKAGVSSTPRVINHDLKSAVEAQNAQTVDTMRDKDIDDVLANDEPLPWEDKTCPVHPSMKMFHKTGIHGDFWTHGEKQPDGSWKNCTGTGWK